MDSSNIHLSIAFEPLTNMTRYFTCAFFSYSNIILIFDFLIFKFSDIFFLISQIIFFFFFFFAMIIHSLNRNILYEYIKQDSTVREYGKQNTVYLCFENDTDIRLQQIVIQPNFCTIQCYSTKKRK